MNIESRIENFDFLTFNSDRWVYGNDISAYLKLKYSLLVLDFT